MSDERREPQAQQLVRVSIADRHPLFRDALARAIKAIDGFELVAESADPWAAFAEVARLRPDVAVVDPSAPGCREHDFLELLARSSAPTRFVLLTARPDSALTYPAIAGGVAGVLDKNIDGPTLRRALLAVSRGEKVLAPEAQRRVAAELRSRRLDGAARLAEREHQVLAGLAAGSSGPQIARELGLGSATVKTYLSRLYAKLGVSDRAAAVAQAMRQGLIE